MQMFATEPASQFSILEEELYAKQYAGLSHFLDVIPWCGMWSLLNLVEGKHG